MVKGFTQKKGIYFDEIFSSVVKMTSIRIILSLVAVEDLHLEQLDVNPTFLHGDLEEEIYATTTRMLGPYNTSDYPITIVVIPLIYIVVPLLPP